PITANVAIVVLLGFVFRNWARHSRASPVCAPWAGRSMIGCRKCLADRPAFAARGSSERRFGGAGPRSARTNLDAAERRPDRGLTRPAAEPDLLLPQRAHRPVGTGAAGRGPRGLPLRRRRGGLAGASRHRAGAPRDRRLPAR